MRLIDAEMLEKYLTGIKPKETFSAYGKGVLDILTHLLSFVRTEMPTIEAEPVRHGRWCESYNRFTCTACGAEFNDELPWATFGYVEFNKAFAYCPTCGAKMDGGDQDAAD